MTLSHDNHMSVGGKGAERFPEDASYYIVRAADRRLCVPLLF
jgi:hypothetical protein